MKRIIILALSLFFSIIASAQYIDDDVRSGDTRIITCSPYVQEQDGEEYMIYYKYMEKGDIKAIVLEIICGKQKGWWTVPAEAKAIVKFMQGGFHSIPVLTSKIEDVSNKIMSVSILISPEQDKHIAGISDIMFRTSSSVTPNIKIKIGDDCRFHLQRSLAELVIRAGI